MSYCVDCNSDPDKAEERIDALTEAVRAALDALRLYGGTYGTGDDAVREAREILEAAIGRATGDPDGKVEG